MLLPLRLGWLGLGLHLGSGFRVRIRFMVDFKLVLRLGLLGLCLGLRVGLVLSSLVRVRGQI